MSVDAGVDTDSDERIDGGESYGRMLLPPKCGVTAAPGYRGCLVVRSRDDDAVMVVEAYAIPRSSHPWSGLLSALGAQDARVLHVGDVTVLGRDDGRVLARAYISHDRSGLMRSVFQAMDFNRGDAPMPPMTVLSASDDDMDDAI